MAITDTAVNFRTLSSVKTEAFQVIEQYGLTPSQVFNMFLTQIANTKTIPVDLNYLRPNAETLSAMAELENGQAESFWLENQNAEQITQRILTGDKT